MNRFIIDSFAWIEYLLGTERGVYVKNIVEDNNNEIFTHILSLAEISSRLSRSGIDSSESIKNILSISKIFNINNNISIRAGQLHSEIRKKIKDFGLVDAFILLSAKDIKIKVLTGDEHFKNFKEADLI